MLSNRVFAGDWAGFIQTYKPSKKGPVYKQAFVYRRSSGVQYLAVRLKNPVLVPRA